VLGHLSTPVEDWVVLTGLLSDRSDTRPRKRVPMDVIISLRCDAFDDLEPRREVRSALISSIASSLRQASSTEGGLATMKTR